MEAFIENLGPWLLAVGVILVILFLGFRSRTNFKIEQERYADLRSREMATIVESASLSGFGGLCVVMLVLTTLIAGGMYGSAKTIFQEIAAGVGWMGFSILFGIGAVMGQRRSYTVYRSVQRADH